MYFSERCLNGSKVKLNERFANEAGSPRERENMWLYN